MELLSINISLPKNIAYDKKNVLTGIFKKPVTGPVMVCKNNLMGDQQADLVNHGGEHKAVYAFSSDHYAYWCGILNKTDFPYGQFGENLTISGLYEQDLYIGTHLKIGTSLLEITQPRVPCFKLGIIMGNKKMPGLFIKNAATGVYLRVIQEGMIEAGNSVKIVGLEKHKLSVQTLFKAIFEKSSSETTQILETALKIPALSQEWREKILRKLTATDTVRNGHRIN